MGEFKKEEEESGRGRCRALSGRRKMERERKKERKVGGKRYEKGEWSTSSFEEFPWIPIGNNPQFV